MPFWHWLEKEDQSCHKYPRVERPEDVMLLRATSPALAGTTPCAQSAVDRGGPALPARVQQADSRVLSRSCRMVEAGKAEHSCLQQKWKPSNRRGYKSRAQRGQSPSRLFLGGSPSAMLGFYLPGRTAMDSFSGMVQPVFDRRPNQPFSASAAVFGSCHSEVW